MVLEIRDFGLSYGDRLVLSEISFSVPNTGCLVLLGPSGTGKSSLLRTIAGLNEKNPMMKWWGEVTFKGMKLSEGNRPPLVLQKPQLMVMSVLENLRAGLRDRSELSKSEQISIITHAATALDEYWVLNVFQEPLVNLNLRQQRSISIIKTQLSKSPLLLIDEATAGLPGAEAARLIDLIKKISSNQAVLLVTHHLGEAREIADQVVLMASGKVQEQADGKSFFGNPKSASATQFIKTGSCAETPVSINRATISGNYQSIKPSLNTEFERSTSVNATTDCISRKNHSPKSKARCASQGPNGFAWLLPGQLAGTPKPGIIQEIEEDLALLRNVGITHLINLTEDQISSDLLAKYGIESKSFPIKDMCAPDAITAAKLCECIDKLLNKSEVVAIHCKAGLGRTGTILAAYYLWRTPTCSDAEQSIKKIRIINASMIQSGSQLEFIRKFSKLLKSHQESHHLSSRT